MTARILTLVPSTQRTTSLWLVPTDELLRFVATHTETILPASYTVEVVDSGQLDDPKCRPGQMATLTIVARIPNASVANPNLLWNVRLLVARRTTTHTLAIYPGCGTNTDFLIL